MKVFFVAFYLDFNKFRQPLFQLSFRSRRSRSVSAFEFMI